MTDTTPPIQQPTRYALEHRETGARHPVTFSSATEAHLFAFTSTGPEERHWRVIPITDR